jgi:hypothetical protein
VGGLACPLKKFDAEEDERQEAGHGNHRQRPAELLDPVSFSS